ncbi:hypothetical protein ACQKGC_06655 [Allorhizobium pseudoryzae]|uniref:hypothetical protein n=1 Tax=Allorhizobium pseudoryzae TaxID=379684 RepID=UPI003D0018A4
MAEDINNLVLEHLRAVRADMREQGSRLTRIELALAGLRRAASPSDPAPPP